LSTKTASKQAKLPLNPSNSQEPHQPHKKHKTLSLSLPPGNLSNSATVVVPFCLCKSLQLVVAATRSKKQKKKKKKKSFPHDKTIEPNEPKLQKKSADPRNQSGERRRHPVKQLESHRELQQSSVSPRRHSNGWRSGIQSGR